MLSIGPTETLVMVRCSSSRTSGVAALRHVSGVRHQFSYIQSGRAGSGPAGVTVRPSPAERPVSHAASDVRRPADHGAAGADLQRMPGLVGVQRQRGRVGPGRVARHDLVQEPVAERRRPVADAVPGVEVDVVDLHLAQPAPHAERGGLRRALDREHGHPLLRRQVAPRRRRSGRRSRVRRRTARPRRAARRSRCRRHAAPGSRTAGSRSRCAPSAGGCPSRRRCARCASGRGRGSSRAGPRARRRRRRPAWRPSGACGRWRG